MPLNNSEELCRIKGILFDVDGTFYYQTPFRAIMILLFVSFNIHNPKELLRKAKVITAYRKAQENLRYSLQGSSNCSIRQIDLAINNTGESHGYVSKTIIEWFEKRPLPFLRLCRRRGLNSVLCQLHQKGFKLGVFSDYPTQYKLLALKIYKYFSTVMSANDPEVKGFKPKTNGFAVAARRMGLKPSEVLYVGDRAEVDGIGASAVGMPVVILKGFFDLKKSCDYPVLSSFDGLPKMFNLSH
jgi:FMN phosphatase YigB (HAD superfamily)